MKIATWNVNSLKVRQQDVLDWISNNSPDFLLLQEIKSTDETLFNPLKELGLYCYYSLQKTYNGVAIISKYNCDISCKNMPVIPNSLNQTFTDTQARILEVYYNNLYIINVYIPNGNPINTDKYFYKLNWLEALYNYLRFKIKKRYNFIIAGDFNIAPYPKDVYSEKSFLNDALTTKESKDWYHKVINMGMVDTLHYKYNNESDIFTWWDYRHGAFAKNNGARIDHILLSPTIADKYKNCFVDKTPRISEKPSDHTPVVVELEN